jgi:hypothetical protein
MKTRNPFPSRMQLAALVLAGFWLAGPYTATAQGTNVATPEAATNSIAAPEGGTNAPATAAAAKPAPDFKPLAPGQYDNWLNLAVGNYFVSGDDAQFQQRHQQRAGAFGGVEDFHWETAVAKKGTFTVDGRALFDNHDYSLTLAIADPEKGYVRAGYRQFRTWYDGSGGFFPPNGQWFDLYNDNFWVDRGEAWIEAGLTLPDLPVLAFRYSHQFRNGTEPSTIWGDTALTGGLGTRAIVPSFYDINERRDLVEVDLTHTIGKTDFGVGGRADFLHQDDSLNLRRRPGETGTTIAGPGTSIDRFVTQHDLVEADLFNVHAFTTTRISESTLFTLGGSFTTMDTDIGGSRIYGSDYDPVYDPNFVRRQERDSGFLDLSGGAQWKQAVGNINLMLTPFETFCLVPSLRLENVHQDGIADYISTDVGAAPTFTPSEEDLTNLQKREYTEVTEALEMRYTGVTNWVFYLRGEWLEGQGNLKETQANTELPPPEPIIQRDTDSTRFTQKYVLGVNWYPQRSVSLAAQYYHKAQDNDYNHVVDSTSNATNSGNRYPAFLIAQDFQTDDVNFRITWRPCSFLTSISRYDFQLSTIDTTGDNLASVQSGELHSQIFSQSFTIVPWNPLYFQLSGTYVYDDLNTPATSQPGAAADLVTKSRNGYWNASAAVGWVFNARTDLQLQYSYYQANDFMNNSAVSTPYGTEDREHGVTVTLNRMFTPRLRWSIRYGFYDYNDNTSGGHNDYTAHLVYSSLQYRF